MIYDGGGQEVGVKGKERCWILLAVEMDCWDVFLLLFGGCLSVVISCLSRAGCLGTGPSTNSVPGTQVVIDNRCYAKYLSEEVELRSTRAGSLACLGEKAGSLSPTSPPVLYPPEAVCSSIFQGK